MTLKNIMVHIDSGPRTAARVDVAKSLASRCNARLVGVFGQQAYAEHVGVVVNWPSNEYIETVEVAKAMFERATSDMPNTAWHDINRGSENEVVKQIARYARYGDMMVLGQHDYAGKTAVPQQLIQEVAVASGRSVLVIPCSGEFPIVGRRPLIVWNDSREVARALNDSLSLIEENAEAILLCLANDKKEARLSSLEVERHLACHGIVSTTEVHSECSEGLWEMVCNRMTRFDSDLLIIGAHGQLGFPFVRCEVVLQEMTVPVLMAG